jgi:hypothetical protein
MRNRIPVKCALQRVLDSRHGEPLADYNRLDVNGLGVRNNEAIEDARTSPPKMRSAKRILQLKISDCLRDIEIKTRGRDNEPIRD